MSLLIALAALPNDHLVLLDGETPKLPQNGERAYTKYRGDFYEGVLFDLTEKGGGRLIGKIQFQYLLHGKERYEVNKFISVGYDERIVWDASAGMWHAFADWD